MFTGLVEAMGDVTFVSKLDSSESGGGGFAMTVGGPSTAEILTDCKLGDSIAINGTCLTVTEFDDRSFKVGISPETLRKTNLGALQVGSRVNLERAMTASARFGGHFVQGHVDTTATITNVRPDGNALWFDFTLHSKDAQLMTMIVPKGYVTLDGTSLTVTETRPRELGFSIMLIAYSQQRVILTKKKAGDTVNVEVDMLGKYVERVVEGALASAAAAAETEEEQQQTGTSVGVDGGLNVPPESPLVSAVRTICERVVKQQLKAIAKSGAT